ncbi:MAG: AAA family ATPase [Bacteroidetes bacterium]|nr:AAA family ATPase [Bacteroidota bacterium]
MEPDIYNENFKLAADLVNFTSQNIFLTGKAGTGKTTFLKHIRNTSLKNMAVVAPTGVAAINAGGVTMHSFFLLPFEPFLPVRGGWDAGYANQSNLFSKVRLSKAKREVMEQLELLIIDEISMVRCDKLDATDAILRYVRKSNLPFGGVQMVFIGDMFQLPPVTKDDEWAMLKNHYESPFFFHSKVVRQFPPLHIELKKIYRQKEQQFIDLLNNIRNNTMEQNDFEILQSRYNPNFKPGKEENYITISTHNYKADAINDIELQKLPGKAYTYTGKVEGEFNENNYPTDLHLTLKENAQVMFIKNDSGEDRKYYNGKLARIKELSNDSITVITNEDNFEIELEIEEWENVKYNFNKEKNILEEELIGKFQQFPIRLAWAITIHKSQGLTFDKVIIDAGQSFAAGQVYVALSRCTTLDGMVLLSSIRSNVINTDERILNFSGNVDKEHHLHSVLDLEKNKYMSEQLIKAFDYQKIIDELTEYVTLIPEKNIPDKLETYTLAKTLLDAANAQGEIARKFKEKLPALIADYQKFQSTAFEQKVRSGVQWFAQSLTDEIIQPLFDHYNALSYASKVKTYRKEVADLVKTLQGQLKKILQARYGDLLFADVNAYEKFNPKENKVVDVKKSKPAKGDSKKESLQLYNEGLSLEEIAKMRNLAVSTIEGHLADFVLTGEVDIYKLLTESQVKELLEILEMPGVNSASDVRNKGGSSFNYSQIKAVINYKEKNKPK